MKNRFFPIASVLFFMSACHAGTELEPQKKNDLAATISLIIEDTSLHKETDFTPDMLYSSELFRKTFAQGCTNIADAVNLLNGSQKLDPYEETVLAHLQYYLPLGEYLDWIDKVKLAYDDKRVSLSFLKTVVTPDLMQRADLYLAYEAGRVRELYESLLKYPEISGNVEDLLNGKTASFIRSYFPSNQMKLPSVDPNSRCK